jgi:hypothetical protein
MSTQVTPGARAEPVLRTVGRYAGALCSVSALWFMMLWIKEE